MLAFHGLLLFPLFIDEKGKITFSYVHKFLFPSFSLFQADQLMFAMHFVKGMYPELFQESVSIFVNLVSAFLGFPQHWIQWQIK